MGLQVPKRKALLASYARAQRVGKLVVLFEGFLAFSILYLVPHSALLTNPLEALIVLGVAVFPTLLSLAYLFAKKRKLVKDLKPTTQYGHLNRTSILEVCDGACNKMGVKPSDVRFYVTSEKQVNASALTLGLGYIFKNLRIVMLNRSTLHALKKYELQSVVAHELAHIYRYPLFYQEALLVRLFTGSIFGLALLSLSSNVLIAIIVAGIYQGIVGTYFARYSTVIEYLCDDCGAEVAGLLPALRAEFLISKHSETLSEAYFLLLKAKKEGQQLSAKDLNTLLEDSLSYDCLSSEELNATLEKNLKAHKQIRESSFFQYFKAQIFSDSLDADEMLEDEYLDLKKIRSKEVLELPPHEGELTLSWFKEFVSRIKEKPGVPAFRTTNDLDDASSTHPGPRKRMVYLWNEYGEG